MTVGPGTSTPRVRRRPRRPANWMLNQLPEWMLVDDFLVRFVSLFQSIADTHQVHVDQLEHVFDISVAPPEMVRLMGRWIGVDFVDESLAVEQQRLMVQKMAELRDLLCTQNGLRAMLELVTGGPVEVVDSGGTYPKGAAPGYEPHVRIRLDPTTWMDDRLVRKIVRRELPASVTFEIEAG